MACVVVPCIISCGTAPTSPFHENLDRETGVTVSRLNEAMMFYDPLTSAPPPADQRGERPRRLTWRDFLYLGPLEINRTGTRTYYMWASLVRREHTDEPELPVGLVIVADEQPIVLQVLTHDRAVLGAGEPTYPAPAPWAGELYLPVRRAELEEIAGASRLRVQVRMASGRELVFEPMRDDHDALQNFVRFVIQGQAW